jgi:hypothetical protein
MLVFWTWMLYPIIAGLYPWSRQIFTGQTDPWWRTESQMNVLVAVALRFQCDHGKLQINHEDYPGRKEFWPYGLRWKAQSACRMGDGLSRNSGRGWSGWVINTSYNSIRYQVPYI